MDTCFLFTKYLNDSSCFSFMLNQQSELTAPAQQRTFVEIQTLQQGCKTYVIESCEHTSILDLELPFLPDRKARIAIPYAVEDQLAQPIDELHFAFDKQRYHNGRYLITVISQERLKFIMNLLEESDISYELITTDWFALNDEELCVAEDTLIVNNTDFKGALAGELALTYLQNHPQIQAFWFKDSNLQAELPDGVNKIPSWQWIGQRIMGKTPLNLCQGAMRRGTDSEWIMKGYLLAGGLCCTWLVSLILVNALSLHSLNKQTAVVDKDIAAIYYNYFPEAKQVITPKFRISQLLGEGQAKNQDHFWFLLNQFTKAIKKHHITVEQIRFQNKTLAITLSCADFSILTQLEAQLKQLQVKVKQTQASTREQQVVATLELS